MHAAGERSFSALRQGKTYFSSTTGDSRLDHHMMLHVHRDGTDAPTLVDGANDSLGRKKTERCCLEKSPRTISQTGPLFRQSQHKREIRDKKKRYCRQMYWSDTTKEYALTEEPKPGGGAVDVGHLLAPSVILCLLRACGCDRSSFANITSTNLSNVNPNSDQKSFSS